MKLQKQDAATLGLILITCLAAVLHVFLRDVPDTVSIFSFVCITNVIGFLALGIVRFKKLISIPKRTLGKGILLAVELTGFNYFLMLGSRQMDIVMSSSVISLYFVFVTPLLLLLRKKVNFFSGIATVIAVIALLLLFGADADTLFASREIIYLIIADLFFAAYVVSVSILGKNEDSSQLTLAQLVFAAVFAFLGWMIENSLTGRALALPAGTGFWISALLVGICMRAVCGIVQIACQKRVPALKASLIFSMEIIITLLMNPILCRILQTAYTPVTAFQVLGGVLLIIAAIMVDDTVMEKLGFGDLKEITEVNERGEIVMRSSVGKKMILSTLTFTMITLVVSTVIFLSAIFFIRSQAVSNSENLGRLASDISSEAMMKKLEESVQNQVEDKALLAEQKLSAYSNAVQYAAAYADALYRDRANYPDREVPEPRAENGGVWTMQRTYADADIPYELLEEDCRLLGNMEDVFDPIVKSNENINTIYLGTERGLVISYDTYSDFSVNYPYYEFRRSYWFTYGIATNTYFFTKPYQDVYGRGLTITCAAPFHRADGRIIGCVAIDILMDQLNDSMVNDGIVNLSIGTLIDKDGKYIVGKDVDPQAKDMGSIFDEGRDPALREFGQEILKKKDGIVIYGEGEDAVYLAFSEIDSTDWILCIQTPVSSVIRPAVAIRESIDTDTRQVVSSVSRVIMNIIQSGLVLTAVILLSVTMLTGRSSRKISAPLKRLEEDVKQISDGNLDSRTRVSTDDEIGSLADSFNQMADSLQKYIADLKDATAKEERITSELSVATRIQASMLPRDFAAFCEGRPFELSASMYPAKEVGGDFYDYFMIDDTHLGLVMADVSGKGVPAALFMVVSKMLIKKRAQMGGSPSEIIEYVNEQLCEGNEGGFFVTVWFAVLDLRTGKGMAVNAGHEHPVIRRAGGKYELVVYKHSIALGIMEGMRFREHEFALNPGDCLFVYTDGVTEATDENNRLFGTDRLLAALNRKPEVSPEILLRTVKIDINNFVGSVPQFDDTTMLGFRYLGA